MRRPPAVDRDVATAAGHGGKPRPRRLRIWKWVPIDRPGALAGYCCVEFAIGLRIADLPVFRTGTSGPWVGLQRVPKLDRERRQMRDDAGKPLFEAGFAWRNRAVGDAFSRAVLALLLKKWPDALDERGPRQQPASASAPSERPLA